MENAATSPKRECDSNVEITPESPLIIKLPSYLQNPRNGGPADATKPEAAVKVLVYVGTPSNRIGSDGDFYLEEETNLLYGPKANGLWPEDGVPVSGPVMRRKRREAQRAWSMDVPKKSFTAKIGAFLLAICDRLRGDYDALPKTQPRTTSRKGRATV